MFRIVLVAALPLVVVSLLAAPAVADDVHQGKVIGVGESSITIQDKDGENETFTVADDATITHNGKPAKLNDLVNGDMAKVTVKIVKGKTVATMIEAKSKV